MLLLLYKFLALGTVLIFFKTLTVHFDWNLSLIIRGDIRLCYKIKKPTHSPQLTELSLRIRANLRNKRKLAAVSRETPADTGNSHSQNTLDPGMAQHYISQVSEEIEGRVIKKIPKNSAGRSHVFWVLCLSLTNFFWSHKLGLFP